jgi:hypothetical protein
MSTERTPPLTLRGSKEVLEEMSRPPADTPQRRAMFERVRAAERIAKHSEQPAAGKRK